jgi:putative DNA primase/helicase
MEAKMDSTHSPQAGTGTIEQRQIVKEYRYEDEKGELLYEVVRFTPKGFSQRRPDGNGGYINNIQGVRRVLYKLPQLIATLLDVPVIIVEGEKDADRLILEGLSATTNPGGAGKWLKEYNEYFRGRHVAILPDNDEPGRRHAEMVAESLYDVAASVKIVELPQREPAKRGYDISDFLNDGHKFGEISILIDNTPQYVKEEPLTRKAVIISFDKIQPLEIDWLWPNRFPLGMISLLVGDPGVGKSFFSLYMSMVISNGGIWPDGSQCPHGSAIILSCEDSPEHVISRRLIALNTNLSKVHWFDGIRDNDKNGNEFTEQFNIMRDLLYLQKALKEHPDTKMIVIDPLSAYFGCVDTHKDSNVRSVMGPLTEIARRHNVAIVGVMHLNKGNSSKAVYKMMGSLAFPASARTVWSVSPTLDGIKNPRRLLLPVKHNILDNPTTLAFEIKDGQLIFESEPVNISADEVLTPKSNIESPERDRAVEWLKQLLAGGISMSSNEIFKLAEAEGFNERTLARARKELGIKCFPGHDSDGNKCWHWQLPKPEGEQLKIPGLAEAQARANETLKRMRQNMKMPKLL